MQSYLLIHSTFRVYHYGLKVILFQRLKSNIAILLLKLFGSVPLGGLLSSEKISLFLALLNSLALHCALSSFACFPSSTRLQLITCSKSFSFCTRNGFPKLRSS